MMQNPFIRFFENSEPAFKKWAVRLGIFVPLAGLALMAYLGWYNRYWSDDWCYNVDFENLGIAGTVNTYFMTGEEALRCYAPNRYSLTLLSGILFSTGVFGAQVTATLVIFFWVASLLWLSTSLAQVNDHPSKGILLLGSILLIYNTLFISPQRFQVLYWMAGIHYSFSIIAGIFLAGLIARQAINSNRSRVIDFLIAPLAFLAGGFSETGCAYLLTAAVLALGAAWYWKQRQTSWAARVFPTLILAVLGLVLSLGVLALAPSNAARVDVFSREPTPLPLTIMLSFRFVLDFIVDSLRSIPLPHFVFVLVFLSISILARGSSHTQRPGFFGKSALSILVVLVIAWLLISAVQAPTVYFYGTPPDPRGKSLARFTMLAGLAVSAWIAGQWINAKWKNSLLITLALLGVMLGTIYTARSMTRLYAELPGFVERANLWDRRDTGIHNALQAGETRLEVLVIDMQDVGVKDIMSSSQMNGEWVSTCASRYYGLEAIKAVSP